MTDQLTKPCAQCPWRLANHGKPTPGSFYSKANLRRLWNQVRGGGNPQSCHLTDPSHPDHVDAGAKPGASPKECPGSVIVVLRELEVCAGETKTIDGAAIDRYLAGRRRGLTRRGMAYWIIDRIQLAGVPTFGGPKLPQVDTKDAAIGLPLEAREG